MGWRPQPPSSTPTSTPSMPRSSNCSTRRCAASRSPSAAGSCWPLPTKRRPSGSQAACRAAGARALSHLIFVGGHFGDYQRLGDAVIEVLNDFTPLVERISIDEAFADVAGCTHLFGPPGEIARAIRRRVRTELGLPISIGVARTKHLAKIASQVAKPDGLVVVDPGTELDFLHDLPVELMWGVGPVTKDGSQQSACAPSGNWRTRPDGRSRPCSVRRRRRSSPRWPLIAIRAKSGRSGGRDGGAQSALGRKPADERVIVPTLRHLADRVRAGCAANPGPAGRSWSASALPTFARSRAPRRSMRRSRRR